VKTKLFKSESCAPRLEGRIPIVLAYGIRWDRKLWAIKLNKKLPKFNDFPTIGIYIYYWEGKTVYIGFSDRKKGGLHNRITDWHHEVGDDWDSFSWFVINPQLYVKDIENLMLRTLTYLGPGQNQHRGKAALVQPIDLKNTGASGFLVEYDKWRNYWLDDAGRLTVARESARSILTPEWQRRCRLKRQKD